MSKNVAIEKDQSRVLDLMAQIKKLNTMIELHKNESKDKIMVSQYADMKHRFLLELKDILSSYEIDVNVHVA